MFEENSRLKFIKYVLYIKMENRMRSVSNISSPCKNKTSVAATFFMLIHPSEIFPTTNKYLPNWVTPYFIISFKEHAYN